MSSSKKISSSPTPQQHLPSPPPIPKFYDYENCAIYKETPRFSPIPPPNSSSNSRGRLERINPSRQQDPSSRSFAGGREGSNSNSSSSSTHRVQPYPLSSSRGAGGELSRSNPPPVFRSDKLIPHSMPFDWISSSSKQQQQQQQLEKIDFKIMLLDKNQLLLGNDDQITTCNNNIAKFCHKGTVDKLIKARASLSSSISNTDYIRARAKANPYDKTRTCAMLFKHATTAIKLANLNSLAHFDKRTVESDGVFRFADLCGGPGGFAEFMLWRIQSQLRLVAQGWGITLNNNSSIPITSVNNHHQHAVKGYQLPRRVKESGRFVEIYGVGEEEGFRGTGDLTDPANMNAFQRTIMDDTGDVGVDLVLADGEIEGIRFDSPDYETKSHQLLICQIVTMFRTLRMGGDFLLKLGDVLHPLTVELVYLIYKSFDRVAMIKPYTSTPTNSERYLICKNLKFEQPEAIIKHLDEINQIMINSRGSGGSGGGGGVVMGLFDPTRVDIGKDEDFMDWIQGFNMKSALKQVEAINELLKYAQDSNLEPFDQMDIRRRCFIEWGLPPDSK